MNSASTWCSPMSSPSCGEQPGSDSDCSTCTFVLTASCGSGCFSTPSRARQPPPCGSCGAAAHVSTMSAGVFPCDDGLSPRRCCRVHHSWRPLGFETKSTLAPKRLGVAAVAVDYCCSAGLLPVCCLPAVACLPACLPACLVGWLVGCLVAWLVAWLLAWLVAWLVACLVGWLFLCGLFDFLCLSLFWFWFGFWFCSWFWCWCFVLFYFLLLFLTRAFKGENTLCGKTD